MLTAVLVPVGIAYAVAAGVPPIAGLYATIFGLLAYALFGPSQVLVLGPDSALVALILGVVLPLSGGDPQRAVALAAMMALVSGAVCVLAGIARLGFVTELLSKPIRYGYMNGIALTILVSQLPALFGFSGGGENLLDECRAFFEGLAGGKVNPVALSLGAGTLAAILLLKRVHRLPAVLLAVVGAAGTVAALDLSTRAGVPVLGSLPQGLPAFALPMIRASDIVPVLMAGVAAALISFADTSVLSRAYAAQAGRPADPNQEMVALGAANLAAGSVPGHPDQRQRLAHARGRGRGSEDATGRGGGRGGRGVPPDVGPRSPRHPAQGGTGRGRDRLRPRPVRDPRPAPDPSHPALGILAVDRLSRRRGGAGADPGHRPGDRHCRDRVSLGRLAAAFGRARSRRRCQGLPRHRPLSVGAGRAGAGALSLGCAAVLRQRRVLPRPRPRRGGRVADAGPLAGRGSGAGDQRRRDRRRRRRGARQDLARRRASTFASPR